MNLIDKSKAQDEKEKNWMIIQERLVTDMIKRMYIVMYEILKLFMKDI